MTDALDRLLTHWGVGRSDISRATGLPPSRLRNPDSMAVVLLERLDRFLSDLHRIGMEEPATFMSVPLVEGYTATGWQIYAQGGAALLTRHASGELSAKVMLARFDPDWHTRFWSDYETFEAADGNRAIRRKGGDR